MEEAFHDVELEQLQAVFPPTVELSEFIGSQAERRAEVPMDSPKEKKASTMQTPHAPYASRFIGLGGLGGLGNTISFHYPPHPDEKTEKEARQLTEEVLQTLMNSWKFYQGAGSWMGDRTLVATYLFELDVTAPRFYEVLSAPYYYMDLI